MKRVFPNLALASAALLSAFMTLPAAAQFAKPDDAIKYRRASMTVMGAHFGRVAAMANGRIPFDAKTAAENAEVAAFMSKLVFSGFVEGSDKGDTEAEPKIWSEREKFNAAAAKMQDAMSKLDAAARSGSLDAIKAAAGETGKSCKACHDSYRK